MKVVSQNFGFLLLHDPQLVRLGALAERYFAEDANTCLMKVRQFGELLAQLTAAKSQLYTSAREQQVKLLQRLEDAGVLPEEPAKLFHQIRREGNRATHTTAGEQAEALASLKIARQLGVWFHRTFGEDPAFTPGPFVPPPDPVKATAETHAELERLRNALEEKRSEMERALHAAEEAARERLTAEERAQREADDRAFWEQLAVETEQAKNAVEAQLQVVQAAAAQAPAQWTRAIVAKAARAAQNLDIDEATTRTIIDAQLRARGWEVDTQTIRYSEGAHPAKGHNYAIAEWPTDSGPADYALFVGLECIGIVEAKRRNRNVSDTVDQAQRYARGFQFKGDARPVGGPWADTGDAPFLVPFVFSANGRPYLKQLETESGIWFRDTRRPSNLRRPLVDWPTPDGLQKMLEVDVDAAQAELKAQPIEFAFPLRDYQRQAIEAIEAELARGTRAMLLEMATGTGKTKLSIALLYRLLTTKRFQRVCFVVDRTALGTQAAGEFQTTRVVSGKTFGEVFGLKGLEAAVPEPETKVHICTIQGLVKRVLYAAEDAEVPPVDQYDLIVVDECHRGYLLDREMSGAELTFRSQDDYVSKYRKALDHFNAVKIGLTATPARHTVEIFGKPIFTYSYHEAVVDGHLIDHEPPIRIKTELTEAGITLPKGELVEFLDPETGHVDLAELPDELAFDVSEFNSQVITVPFNRVVAGELAKHIDPDLPGKTLVFAVSERHADIVVAEMKDAFKAAGVEIEDDAVKRITGTTDRVGEYIKAFRNDAFPKVAVTVDLLTTGIDVPKITNIVFLRRVNSRILYEQMLGRATRTCEEIGKETFRIFDAVDLYARLEKVTAMRPVVVDPAITFERLFDELWEVPEDDQRKAVRDQILVKIRRRIRHLGQEARDRYEHEVGESPEATLERLARATPKDAATWSKARPNIGRALDWVPDKVPPRPIPIALHEDRPKETTRDYWGQSAEDFLEGFATFVRNKIDQIPALARAVGQPQDLTRADLRTIGLELTPHHYTEAWLQRAWEDTHGADVKASIIGFVRHAATGEALMPFAARVDGAMRYVLSSRPWEDRQKQWLRRIGEQVLHVTVVDRSAIDEDPFAAAGGFRRLDSVFKGQLETVLADINGLIWSQSS